MRPLDRLASIKQKLGLVIVAAVVTTLVVNEVGLRLGLRPVFRGAVAAGLALLMVQVLGARPGVVFTREQLLADVWGYRDGSGARTVDSHIRSLRQKLGSELIRTVHGVGYAVEPA